MQDLGSPALGRGSPNLSHALIDLRQPSRHVTVVLPARRRRPRRRCLLLGMRRGALLGITVAVNAVQIQVAKLPAGQHGKKAGSQVSETEMQGGQGTAPHACQQLQQLQPRAVLAVQAAQAHLLISASSSRSDTSSMSAATTASSADFSLPTISCSTSSTSSDSGTCGAGQAQQQNEEEAESRKTWRTATAGHSSPVQSGLSSSTFPPN
jgi:hypothetical protein